MSKSNYKDIHTTISKDLWLHAQINDVKWSEALEVGLRSLLGVVKSEEDDLKEKISHHKGMISALDLELTKLQSEKAKNNLKDGLAERDRVRKEAETFRRMDVLRHL